jgi:enoyl-CoA hydratase
MSDAILCEKDGDITNITLNRPEIGNRLTDPMAAQLAGMIDEASRSSRMILFRAAGDDFCLGRDRGTRPSAVTEAYGVRERSEVIFNTYEAFRRSQIPVVGVVRGKAIGFGCALAALCDITIASENALFQLPEMAHRIMPTIAMSSLIDRVPRKALLYLVYSTAEVDAQAALTFGLVSRVVPEDGLESAVATLIERMKHCPVPALLAVKEYARSAYGMDTAAANAFAKNLHATVNSYSKMRS